MLKYSKYSSIIECNKKQDLVQLQNKINMLSLTNNVASLLDRVTKIMQTKQ